MRKRPSAPLATLLLKRINTSRCAAKRPNTAGYSHRRRQGSESAGATLMSRRIKLEWQKFTKLTDARSRFAKASCVYVQTDPQGCPIRIGKASEGLEARYRGGTVMR